MRINIFQINDWDIKEFFGIILTIHLIFLITIELNSIGIEIPIIKQLFGFIFLTFVPGLVLMRIIGLHKLDGVETILYSVGLSIAFLMFTGAFINLLPTIGVLNPISFTNFFISTNIIMVILYIMCYFRNRRFSVPITSKLILDNKTFFLLLIPFLSVFGTYFFNNYNSNAFILILILIISLFPLFVIYDKIPKNLYPLTTFVISISLLYHSSLISNFLVGTDIFHEYFLQSLVFSNQIWDPSKYGSYNIMLSITILPNFYALMLDLKGIWVLKIIYPFIFSLLPLGLYKIFKESFNDKISFLAVFFFMSFSAFFTELLGLARQEIAELYFVLLILVMLTAKINEIKKSVLLIVFGVGLVLSHYALSYFFIFYIFFILIIPLSIMKLRNIPIIRDLFGKNEKSSLNIKNPIPLSATYIVFLIVFAFAWYLYLSNASTIADVLLVVKKVYTGLFTEFFNAASRESNVLMAIGLGSKNMSLQREIFKYLQYLSQFFIVIGFISLIKDYKNKNFNQNYLVIVFTSLFLLIISVILPHFSNTLNMVRIYHITLLFLSPLCILGCIILIKLILKPFKIFKYKYKNNIAKIILSGFLISYFLFNTGFIYELTGDNLPTDSFRNLDFPRFNQNEVSGATWLDNHLDKKKYKYNYVYADTYRMLLLGGFNWHGIVAFPYNLTSMNSKVKDYYIFFGTINIQGKLLVNNKTGVNNEFIYINGSSIIKNSNKIYDNGGCNIWR